MKKTLKILLPVLLLVVAVVSVVLVLNNSEKIIVKSTTVAKEQNFCSVLPDDATANANWRVHQWRDSMIGTFVSTDVGKKMKNANDNVCSEQMNPVTAYDEATSKIETIFGGKSGRATLVFEDMDSTAMSSGKRVKVLVQSVRFTGDVGAVDLPVTESISFPEVENGKLRIKLKDLTPFTAYRVTVSLAGTDEKITTSNDQQVKRFNVKNGKSDFSVKENGTYKLTFAANAPIGVEKMTYSVDGLEYEAQLSKTSTGKFSTVTFTDELERGKHSVKFYGTDESLSIGTLSVDFLDVGFLCGQMDETPETTYFAEINHDVTADTSTSFFLPVDEEGYYNVTFSFYVENSESVPVAINADGQASIYLKNSGSDTVTMLLKKGINKIDLTHSAGNVINSSFATTASNEDVENMKMDSLGTEE